MAEFDVILLVIIGLSGALLLWLLRLDFLRWRRYRRRQNRWCLQCAYDLRSHESGRCPECGWVIEPGFGHFVRRKSIWQRFRIVIRAAWAIRRRILAFFLVGLVAFLGLLLVAKPELRFHPLMTFWRPMDSPVEVFKRFRDAKANNDYSGFEDAAIEIVCRKLLAGASRKQVESFLGRHDEVRWYQPPGVSHVGVFFGRTGNNWGFQIETARVQNDYRLTKTYVLQVLEYKDKVERAYFQIWSGGSCLKTVSLEFQ